jgi:ABC-type lipoprotein release transport system permease subunit
MTHRCPTTVPSLRFIGTLLYGLSPRDPMTLASAAIVLSSVATLAAAGPVWRASRVDPTLALRSD